MWEKRPCRNSSCCIATPLLRRLTTTLISFRQNLFFSPVKMSCHFFSTLSKTEVLQSAGWIFNLRKPLGKDKLPFSSNPVSQSPASTFPSVLPPRQSFTGVHEGPTVGSGFCSLERASALLVHQRKPLQSSWNGQ